MIVDEKSSPPDTAGLNGMPRRASRLSPAWDWDRRPASARRPRVGDTCLDSHHSIRVSDKRYAIGAMLGTRMCVYCFDYVDEWNR